MVSISLKMSLNSSPNNSNSKCVFELHKECVMFLVAAVLLVFCLLFGGRGERLLDLLCFSFLFQNVVLKGMSVTGITWRRRAEIARCRKKKDNLQSRYTIRSPSFSEFGFVGLRLGTNAEHKNKRPIFIRYHVKTTISLTKIEMAKRKIV